MLPTVLDLLRFLPSLDSDLRSQMSLQIPFETNPPQFTLGLLGSEMRFHWVRTLLIILYKYEYSEEAAVKNVTNSVKCLVQIVINTLTMQHHSCSLDEVCEHQGMTTATAGNDVQSRHSVEMFENMVNMRDG